jgi:hypothetical protein
VHEAETVTVNALPQQGDGCEAGQERQPACEAFSPQEAPF